jgi:hypothetical protein
MLGFVRGRCCLLAWIRVAQPLLDQVRVAARWLVEVADALDGADEKKQQCYH